MAPPRDRIPTNPGHRSPLPGAPPAILEAADDHDVLRDLAGVVYERVLPVIEDLGALLPRIMTKDDCDVQRAKDHPGIRHYLVFAAIIFPLLGGIYGAWLALVRPVLDRLDAVALAVALPPEPRVVVKGETAVVPMAPQIVLAPASAKKKVRPR